MTKGYTCYALCVNDKDRGSPKGYRGQPKGAKVNREGPRSTGEDRRKAEVVRGRQGVSEIGPR